MPGLGIFRAVIGIGIYRSVLEFKSPPVFAAVPVAPLSCKPIDGSVISLVCSIQKKKNKKKIETEEKKCRRDRNR